MSASQPPKPKSYSIRRGITHLPKLNAYRKFYRKFIRTLCRVLLWVFAEVQVSGQLNAATAGPALVVSNHLGDIDSLLTIVYSPKQLEWFVKAELLEIPVLGKLIDMYGVIWVHRGQPDRAALRAALEGLMESRIIALAPEGRESQTGGLEEGTRGAAYLALNKNIPVFPVTFTGTENKKVYSSLMKLKRKKMSITFGNPFYLPSEIDRRTSIREGTNTIMSRLALLLPPELRGVYQSVSELNNGS